MGGEGLEGRTRCPRPRRTPQGSRIGPVFRAGRRRVPPGLGGSGRDIPGVQRTFTGFVDLRAVDADSIWIAGLRVSIGRETRLCRDFLVRVTEDIADVRPGLSVEAARWLSERVALSLGGSFSRYEPSGTILAEGMIGRIQPELVAPELAFPRRGGPRTCGVSDGARTPGTRRDARGARQIRPLGAGGFGSGHRCRAVALECCGGGDLGGEVSGQCFRAERVRARAIRGRDSETTLAAGMRVPLSGVER